MDIKSHNFARILLIKPSSLGDIIHALPLLNGLRQRYPRACISWLVNTEYADLLADHPQLDEVMPFDRRQFKTLGGAVRMTFKLGGFARQLRRRRFDLAIDAQGLFHSGLMALASAASLSSRDSNPSSRSASAASASRGLASRPISVGSDFPIAPGFESM